MATRKHIKSNHEEQNCKAFHAALSQKIRKIRHDKKWTLEKVEEMGFPSWRHLQRIESGSNFTIRTLWKICSVFKINPKDLF